MDIEIVFTNPLLTVVALGLSTDEVVMLPSVELSLFAELSVDVVVAVPPSVELSLFAELSVDVVVAVPPSVELSLFAELSVDVVVAVPPSVELSLFAELSVDVVVTVPPSALAAYASSLTPIPVPKATTAIAGEIHFFPDLYILQCNFSIKYAPFSIINF
nr:hypothetical protein [Macrococcus caseolyticus]